MNKFLFFAGWLVWFLLSSSGTALAGAKDFLPPNKELPLGYKLVGYSETRHPWYSQGVAVGEWKLEQKSRGEEVSSRILVYIGSREGEFDRQIEELFRKVGDSNPAVITLGAEEDKALSYHVRGNYNLYYTKGPYGVIVEALGTDDLVLREITSEQAVEIILKELARNIAQSLPARGETGEEKGSSGLKNSLLVATLVFLIIGGLLAFRRNKPSGPIKE